MDSGSKDLDLGFVLFFEALGDYEIHVLEIFHQAIDAFTSNILYHPNSAWGSDHNRIRACLFVTPAVLAPLVGLKTM